MRRLFPLLLFVSCAMVAREAPRFPAEYLVRQLDLVDRGALSGVDVAHDALLSMVPGELFDHYEWTKDKDRIIAYYRSRGFHQATLDTVEAFMERTGIRLVYIVDPGPALRAAAVSVVGGGAVPASRLMELLGLAPGERVDRIKLELGLGRVRAALAEEGYVHAKATPIIVVEGDRATVTVTIEEGTLAWVGEVSIAGLQRLKPHVAMRWIRLIPGRLFRPGDVYDSQRLLLATGLFSSVRILVPGMEAAEETLRVFIQVREAPGRFIESGIGYASPDRSALSLAVGHQNLLGIAASTRLSLGLDRGWVTDRQQYTAEASFFQPWLLGLPVDAGVTFDYLWRSDPNAWSEAAGTTVELGKSWRERASITGRYRYRSRTTEIRGEDPSDFILEESKRPITNSLGLILSVDRRTSFTDPTGGQLVRVQITHAGGLLGGDWSFRKTLADFSLYHRFWETTMAFRATAGLIRPLGNSPTAPEEERFRAGGANTVRGFTEEGLGPVDNAGNPLGGEAMAIFSAEARVPVWGYVGVAAFFDCGQVWERWRQAAVGTLEPTAGGGLRYATVIGPVRLDWGIPLRGRRLGRVYITLGHAF
ncbi:BamA/TamA family outer membrane protein [Candidatus Fermentibacteria bacterium]|nr:BamA/TamA family outer membrane protein [Candidatus Fermentibacteria bacterium]